MLGFQTRENPWGVGCVTLYESALVTMCAGVKNLRSDEDMKVKEKARESLRIKGAFSAQELYDGHRGITTLKSLLCIMLPIPLVSVSHVHGNSS